MLASGISSIYFIIEIEQAENEAKKGETTRRKMSASAKDEMRHAIERGDVQAVEQALQSGLSPVVENGLLHLAAKVRVEWKV